VSGTAQSAAPPSFTIASVIVAVAPERTTPPGAFAQASPGTSAPT
jgi:hypothetical protein